jgi:ribosomal protein S20
MDIVAVTVKLSKEYEIQSALRTFIKSTYKDIQQAEKRIRQAKNELDFNGVQIRLLETLIKRPEEVKIEAVKRPPFYCPCPDCNPQNVQKPIPTKVAPAKKPAKRSKK